MTLWGRLRSRFAASSSGPAPGAGSSSDPAPGKAGGAAWNGHKAYYVAGNLTRWLIIGVMFVFLLTMAIVLTEVMSFQDRVVRLVGDPDRARDTVLMLHEIESSPDAYPEDQSLPFAALAVYLDRVRSAQEQLGRFREIEGVATEADTDQSAALEDPAKVRFTKERGRLTDNLNELNRVLFEQDPQFRIAQSLEEITRTVDLLGRFTFAPAPAATTALQQVKQARSALEAVRERDDLAAATKGQLEQLDRSTAELEKLLNVDDASQQAAIAAQVEKVRDDLAPLKHGAEPAALAPILAGLEGTAAGLVQLAPNGHGEAAAEMVGKVDDLRAKLTDLRTAAALDVRNAGLTAQLDQFGAAVEALYALRLKGPSGLRATDDADPASPPNGGETEAFRLVLGNIGGAQTDLDRALTARFGTEYTVAKALANNVNSMRDQSEAFAELQAKTYTSAVGEVSEANAAAEAYQKTLAELNQGFADLERSLSNRTRIVAVGDVIRSGTVEGEEQANAKARAILQDFDALGRFDAIMMPLSLVLPADWAVTWIGLQPRKLATLSTVSVTTIYIFMIGAIGSLIYITKYFIGQALRGRMISEPPDRPLSWLVFRPVFGVVVAFALYLVVQAGQLAFGTGDDGFGTDLNIPIISVVALFAGILSWQALAAIETRGKAWF
ncbi:MAG: hypothetical protein ACREJ0_19840, partial [Geminicoccaceae bacterium]